MRGLIADQIPLPYTRPRVDAMQRKLEDFYKKHGYFTATVTADSDPTTADPDDRVATTYVVKPGPLYHFDGVRIVGTDRLKPEYLRNRFRPLSGKVYDPKTLDDIYQLMIRTGLFAQLKVDPVPQPDDTLRLDIAVKESKSRELGFSLGYGTFEGPIFGFEIRDRDFNGTGRPISFEFDYSTRTVSGELLYVDPNLFESDYEMRVRIDALTRDLTAYKKQQFGANVDLSRAITKQFKVSAFAEGDQVKITDHAVQTFQLGLPEYTVSALGGTASLDLRDNPVTTTRGSITSGTFDVATRTLGGDLDFVRATGRFTYFFPIGKKSLFIVGARAGIIQPFGSTAGSIFINNDDDPKTPAVAGGPRLPIDERFFMGGSTSVRSFVERELGPYDPRSKQPIGGESFTLFNAEYQFPLFLADLKGAVFFDAGNLRPRRSNRPDRRALRHWCGYSVQSAHRSVAGRLRRKPRPARQGVHRGLPFQFRLCVLTVGRALRLPTRGGIHAGLFAGRMARLLYNFFILPPACRQAERPPDNPEVDARMTATVTIALNNRKTTAIPLAYYPNNVRTVLAVLIYLL